MEGNINKSMSSEKSVEISLLIDAEDARNRANNSCAENTSARNNSSDSCVAKDCCNISDDESPADDDCIVTLDRRIDSKSTMSSDCVEVDITAQDSTTDDDLQTEVSDLGLKIQDICSLSSPRESNADDILEVIDKSGSFAPSVKKTLKPVGGTQCAKKSAPRSVVQFFEQEYGCSVESRSKGGKGLNWHRNGDSPEWQPVVPLVDIMKRPALRTKGENLPDKEEEDCVVIENDSKMQDVIVVDDVQESNGAIVFKPTCSVTFNNECLSSASHSLSPKAKSSLKRPSSPLHEDGLCRKIPRTECADDLLILDSPANVPHAVQDDLFELHDPKACGDSKVIANQDLNKSIHSRPNISDLNGDCAQVSQSSSVQTVGNHRAEEETRTSPQSPAPQPFCDSGHKGDHVSASSSKAQPGFLSGLASGLAPVPSEGSRDGADKKEEAADSSTGIEVSSNQRFTSLVSYDLSDTDESLSSNSNLNNVSSTCHDITVFVHDNDAKLISTTSTPTSTTHGDDAMMPLESGSRKASEAVSTKTFYGSSVSRDDIFPKQYSVRHSQSRNDSQRKSNQKRDVNQSVIEDVVHISSSDEDEAPQGRHERDTHSSGRQNSRTSHSKEKLNVPPKTCTEPVQSFTLPNKGGRRKSADSSALHVIRPTKIICRGKTCIPRECLLTPAQLSITMKKGSCSFDVGRFVLNKVEDGRIIFRIPNDTAMVLDDLLDLIPKFTPGITSMNSRLTICVDESTPTKTLLSLLEQIKATKTMSCDVLSDQVTLPVEEPARTTIKPLTWIQNISKAVRKRLPKKLASWSRPRHWKKPFFSRYGMPRVRDAAYNPLANDAFVLMNSYDDPYYDNQQQPIQVSGFSGTVIKLFTYPPPPTARGIAVTNEDLFCLNAGEYVNDVIIDFYLKYLYNEVLSAEDRARTHIFSSFFYGHLISVTGKSADDSSRLTVAEQRHQKVRTWTRHVDIFSKDFIIVPINENYHWFLAIICFPALCPETKPTGKDCGAQSADSSKAAEEKQEKMGNNSSSAEAGTGTSDESNAELRSGSEQNSDLTEMKEVVKNPCVLIFDSLQGDIRWDVSRTLREYLQVEWDKKKAASEGNRTFHKDIMKGCRPPCPQQPNYSDCGLYLLQYVEAFFKKPLKDFTLPIRYLRNWFDGSEARAKRSQLRTLILELKDQLNPDLQYDPITDGCCNDVAVTDLDAA